MSWPRRIAISYSRFSDPKQAKGDSETRQELMFREFCSRHNLTALAEVFADRGRSGYKDEHRKKGRLGQLIAMAKDDRFERGTVIVVEAWDRLGRLRPDRQTDLLAELLRTGVSIGVCRLDDIFSEDDFGTHKWTTLAVFIQMAYQESKQKAERVAASWERRRQRARERGELLTARLPAWMECVNGEARLIPERATVVRRIYQLAANGYGCTRIVGTLDKERVAPFGSVVVNEGRTRSQFCGRWTRPYVRLILNDRRAVGEFQPRKIDDSPDGPPLAGFYPAAVTEEEFLLARAAQVQRDNQRDKRGRAIGPRQGSKYVNTFRGLLRHARDGEGWVLHNRGTTKVREPILVNAKGNSGRDRCYTFRYALFEEGILKLLSEVDPRSVLPREKDAAARADVLRAKLAGVRADIARLQDELKVAFSKAIAAVLRDQETLEEQIAVQLQEELSRTVKPAARSWKELPGLVQLIRTADNPDDVRLKLRTVLCQVIDEVWVLIAKNGAYQIVVVQVFFRGDTRREYVLLYRPAAHQRAMVAEAKSLADVVKVDDLDLRRLADAEELAAKLEALDLPSTRKKGKLKTKARTRKKARKTPN
jgi:DNA invertase Pin-like site-specific DNA recombinase